MTRADRDNTCFWRLHGGETCGAKSGRVRKCKAHSGVRCIVCGRPAWRDCQADPNCTAALCRSPACWEEHGKLHGGKVAGEPSPPPAPESYEPAPDCLPCPACADLDHERYTVTARGANESRIQIQCSRCSSRGPVGRTVAIAVSGWDRMPRGRPSVYEVIRRTGLDLIQRELAGYAEMESLSSEDCEAVARMLEAATMAVDTWEL